MRVVALFLIFLSALGFGFELNKNQKRRMEQLYALICFTDYIYAELSARPCSMDELCKKALQSSSPSIKPFLNFLLNSFKQLGEKSFGQIWRVCCNELSCISPQQREIIAVLGDRLGNYELSLQLKAIGSCNAELKREYEKIKSEYPNNSKLCIALPCTLACMILVVLI